MKYALIANGEVTQTQPNPQDGFIEVADDVVCGQIQNVDGTFSNPPLSVPTPAEQAKALETALDAYIDSVAQAKNYDSRLTVTLRAGYPNPWQAEGIAFGTWMDACYTQAFAIQAEVVAGTRPMPTEAELIALMPAMVWPV